MCVCVWPGIESRASYLLNMHFTTEVHFFFFLFFLPSSFSVTEAYAGPGAEEELGSVAMGDPVKVGDA